MTVPASMRTVFVTAVEDERDLAGAATMIDSLRTFGGPLAANPVWVFETDGGAPCAVLRGSGTSVHAVDPSAGKPRYPAWAKTAACARAEEMAGALYRSLVWISPDCLVVGPPVLFDLDGAIRAALRPVAIAVARP